MYKKTVYGFREVNDQGTIGNMILKVICVVCIFFSTGLKAEIYKWVDDQGDTHYGDKPVKDSQEINVDTDKKGHITPAKHREEKRRNLLETYDDDNARRAEKDAKNKKKKDDLKRRCERTKDQLRRYERARYIYDYDKDGNKIILSDDQRAKDTNSLRQSIKKNCE